MSQADNSHQQQNPSTPVSNEGQSHGADPSGADVQRMYKFTLVPLDEKDVH